MNIAIYGYGNLGRGVECASRQNPDINLMGVFTRRNPESVKTLTGVPVFSAESVLDFKNKIDVIIICGGSATDLPVLTPYLAKYFNVVDSYDNHAEIPNHFASVDAAAKEGGNSAIISVGWDPGLFSLARIYGEAALPNGNTYTFWGRGVSQGHSDAIRRIEGVADARQYTVPCEDALNLVRGGENPDLTPRQKHTRECYVVAKEGADKARIEKEIKEMPNYFAPYDTTVTFITAEEMAKNHSSLPHGGFVIRNGKTGISGSNTEGIEFNLKLDSNPEFTSSVLVAYARAAAKLREKGEIGCKTVFDIPPAYLLPITPEEIRKNLL